ncbi:MAG: glycosyltransferase, partial [Chloroflexi bacterium]|nr:glycosyltransferase [Chloroflexota bacterium]
MNILILNRDLNVGGGVTYIRGLCSVLRSRGHRVFIIAGPGPMAAALSKSSDGLWSVPLFSPLQRPWLRHIVHKHAIDVINVHSRTPARMAFPVCEHAGIPMVVTAHGPVYGRRLELLKPIYARAAAFIVMNEQNASYYRGVGVPSDRLHLSRLLVDWSEAQERPARPARTFMYCSRLSGLKGPRAEAWLRAIALLAPDPGARLVVIGSGSYRRRLQEVAASLNL